MKRAAKAMFRSVGLDVRKAGADGSMDAALQRFALTTPIATVIDVGASDGRWSENAMRAFPDAAYLLVEAQSDPHEGGLREFVRKHPNASYSLAAAGDHEGEIHFDGGSAFGGAVSTDATGPHDIVVPMTTIDSEVARRGLTGPFLLKLDTHGFEVPILGGATRTLDDAALLVIEAYNFTLMPGALRFHELCEYLGARGFRPADVVDVMRRPADRLLWQFDLFFIRGDRPEFDSSSYR